MKKLFSLGAICLALLVLAPSAEAMFTVPSGALAFTPRRISNLMFWLDAADTQTITASGGKASQINDKSGNGYNATQGTGLNQPTSGSVTINGRNALGFDGVTSTMAMPSGTYSFTNGNNTIFIVQTPTGVEPVGQARMYNAQDAGTSRYFMYLNATNGLTGTASNNAGVVGATAVYDNNPHVYLFNKNGSAQVMSRDGNTSALNNNSAGANFTATSFFIGSQAGTSNFVKGNIGEVVGYSKSLSNAETNLEGNYLCKKWGCTWTNF